MQYGNENMESDAAMSAITPEMEKMGDPLKDQETNQIKIDTGNIAKSLSDDKLDNISQKVQRGYEIDINSRKDWEERMEQATKVAMQVREDKSYPWPRASNIKYPLITVAAYQFNARAYPTIVSGNRIVKARGLGNDATSEKAMRGERISQHMSYQLMEDMDGWESDMDMALIVLPILGCMFKKTYFSASMLKPISELVFPQDLIVNYKSKSLTKVPRITHRIYLYPDEINSRVRKGMFLKCALDQDSKQDISVTDDDAAVEFLEQHVRADLDGDGYAEPWIITVRADNFKVVRIVPGYEEDEIERNIKTGKIEHIPRTEYFTKYSFLPSPDGGFYDIGFGSLLGTISETTDRTINQLIDAGHLSNVQGGFIGTGLKLKRGVSAIRPGQWEPVNAPGGKIRESIVPLPVKEPSVVLMQLLQFLIDAGKQISSVQDIMTGESKDNEKATTTMARIEQGLKLFTGITKRIHRSFKEELKKLYRLNYLYFDEDQYFTLLDSEIDQKILASDYNDEDLDVVPVADPTIASDSHKIMRAEMLLQFSQDPMFNRQEIYRRYLEALGVDAIDNLWSKEPPAVDPKIELEQAKLQSNNVLNNARLQLERSNQEMKERETNAKIDKLLADTLNVLANAQTTEPSKELEQLKSQFDQLVNEREAREEVNKVAELQRDQSLEQGALPQQPGDINEQNRQQVNNDAGMAGMVEQSNDQSIPGFFGGQPPITEEPME